MNVYYKIRETTTSNIEKAQYIKCHISKYLFNLKKKKNQRTWNENTHHFSLAYQHVTLTLNNVRKCQ